MESHPAGTASRQYDSRAPQVNIADVLEAWSLRWAQFILILLTLIALTPSRPQWAGLWLGLGVSVLMLQLFLALPRRTRADWVTFTRAIAALGFALWFFLSPATSWAKTGIATLILAADGLDGWLARKDGPTLWGGVFDMEVDALVGSIFALLAFGFTGGSAWVLAMAAWRPAYVLIVPWLKRNGLAATSNRTGSWRGKTVCVFTLSVMVAHFAPLPLPLGLLAGLGFLALSYSFGADFVVLFSNRKAL